MEETKERLSVRIRKAGPITILDLAGRLQSGTPTDRFRGAVRQFIESDDPRLILNMAELEYVDSLGLESLIEVYKILQNNQGRLKLLNPTKRVRELLDIARVNAIFDVETDEAEAVAGMSVARRANA